MYLDKLTLKTESNSPVHILNTNGEFSRSSFIPFCSFGDNLIGSKVVGFDMRICNIFKPKLYYDQLCYETDLQELKDSNSINFMNQLELGLTLVLDYNEERQMSPQAYENDSLEKEEFSYNLIDSNSASLHLDTIGIVKPKSQYNSKVQSPKSPESRYKRLDGTLKSFFTPTTNPPIKDKLPICTNSNLRLLLELI